MMLKDISRVINHFFNRALAKVMTVGLSMVASLALASGTPSLPLIFGTYSVESLYLAAGSEIMGMNNWLVGNGASGVSIAGTFATVTFNPPWTMGPDLEAAWSKGYVPFVNFMLSQPWESCPSCEPPYYYYDADCATAAPIAAGQCDDKLAVLADSFKLWAVNGRKAYFAPMPEMNGDWVPYGTTGTPSAYIGAFKRMRQVFANRGVPASAIQWVFAPNGWHQPEYPIRAFENFYPGDDVVDVVGFSAYNYGGCPAQWQTWDTFETAIAPYLQRMRAMAPGKPIFIAQTGVVQKAVHDNLVGTVENKSYWVQDTFGKLAAYPAVRAIVYFNLSQVEGNLTNCNPVDYRIFTGNVGGSGEAGFLAIMKDARFGKWSTADARWDTIAFARPAYSFNDVVPVHPFSGEAQLWYFDAVEKTKSHGVTTGCSVSPPLYCPNNNVSRQQMATFLVRAVEGEPSTTCTTAPFSDVPIGNSMCKYIKRFSELGITTGCGGTNFCPDSNVTRAQMAAFLLRAKYGAAYVPPAVGAGTGFSDVPTSYWAAAWIKQLAAEGVTTGCGGGAYCPEQVVSRAQMAVFLSRTFGW